MNSTTYYRIKLDSKGANSLTKTLVILAAQSNGGDKLTLNQIKTVAIGECIQYPETNKDTSVELIGDHVLHVDRKVNGEWVNVLAIEEVEIFEPKQEEEFVC